MILLREDITMIEMEKDWTLGEGMCWTKGVHSKGMASLVEEFLILRRPLDDIVLS